jgi:hypothetical protein
MSLPDKTGKAALTLVSAGSEPGGGDNQAARNATTGVASLATETQALARMKLLSGAESAPCAVWTLAAATEPQWLEGRWITPDRPRKSEQQVVAAQHMDLLFSAAQDQITGQFKGLYRIRQDNELIGSAHTAGISPVVEFTALAMQSSFDGTLQWKQDSGAEGQLTLAPLASGAIAIRWTTHRLAPGRLQVNGSTGILYRRSGR